MARDWPATAWQTAVPTPCARPAGTVAPSALHHIAAPGQQVLLLFAFDRIIAAVAEGILLGGYQLLGRRPERAHMTRLTST